jgi:hypothetical protein
MVIAEELPPNCTASHFVILLRIYGSHKGNAGKKCGGVFLLYNSPTAQSTDP